MGPRCTIPSGDISNPGVAGGVPTEAPPSVTPVDGAPDSPCCFTTGGLTDGEKYQPPATIRITATTQIATNFILLGGFGPIRNCGSSGDARRGLAAGAGLLASGCLPGASAIPPGRGGGGV